MLTVLQGYISVITETLVLLRCSLSVLEFSSGTLTCSVCLVTEQGQAVVSAQKKSSDKEELLPGEPQD